MTTGARRGELCALQWKEVDLERGVLVLRQSMAKDEHGRWQLKDTKTHQQRRVALDPETVEILRQQRKQCEERVVDLCTQVAPEAFVFSLAPDHFAFLLPESVSQRYGRLARRLGIDTDLHALRHYSATELIMAGVDVRTVAGRLGHSGGGITCATTSSCARCCASFSSANADPRPRDYVGLPSVPGCWNERSARRLCRRLRGPARVRSFPPARTAAGSRMGALVCG